ncbi:MAG: YeeE/YedE family protein [Planctomycetaceae bacterium]|nr:YeeE/YedE family protein [Planctomycetaceae bacterium]
MSQAQWIGLVTGVLFGFLMQKGRVLRFEKQVGAMLLRDMTILKFMLSAILIGMVGVYLLKERGIIELSHKPMNVGMVVIGGILFGAGWSVMGYCPGTSVGAIGEGRWHAIFAVVGMVIGAAVFAEIYPWLNATVGSWKDFGKISLPETLKMSHWAVIALFWVVVLALFAWFEKKKI